MKEHEEFELDLSQIIEAIKKVLWQCVTITMVCAVVFGLYTHFVIPERYTASAKLIINQKSNQNAEGVIYTDIQVSQRLVYTYIEILKSEVTSDVVLNNLKLDRQGITNEEYNSMLSFTAVENTEIIVISATTKDPLLSADVVNEVVDVFTSKIKTIMQVENVTVLDRAKIPTEKSGPSLMKNTIVGGLLGVLCSGLLVLYVLLTDRKIKSEEDVKKIFDYPILGVIPELGIGDERKGKQ